VRARGVVVVVADAELRRPAHRQVRRRHLPSWIRATNALLLVIGFGTRHTLASNLSMQPTPETTASGGHFLSGALGGPAAPAAPPSSSTAASVIRFRYEIINSLSFGCARAWVVSPEHGRLQQHQHSRRRSIDRDMTRSFQRALHRARGRGLG